jgi:hypothetical protein
MRMMVMMMMMMRRRRRRRRMMMIPMMDSDWVEGSSQAHEVFDARDLVCWARVPERVAACGDEGMRMMMMMMMMKLMMVVVMLGEV